MLESHWNDQHTPGFDEKSPGIVVHLSRDFLEVIASDVLLQTEGRPEHAAVGH